MFRIGAYKICLILVFALTPTEFSAKVLDPNIEAIVTNRYDFLSEEYGIKELYPLEIEQSTDNRLQINYKLGNRINGDRLVATASGSNSWSTVQDIKLTLTYPKSGIGSIVTYIQVIVEQSTNIGRGYVTSGGIGQRQITVVIEGNQTHYFRYSAEIYGY